MIKGYASEFDEIPATLAQNSELHNAVLSLIDTQPMPGKVTEGGDRLLQFKGILTRLVNGELGLDEAVRSVETDLPRSQSPYAGDNRVFARSWAERLVRTQYSRVYNQAVMEKLLAEGQTQCFVPHSSAEDSSSKCSLHLAGGTHDLKVLYDRLIASYAKGNWSKELKIPEHPHCTHVIAPIQ